MARVGVTYDLDELEPVPLLQYSTTQTPVMQSDYQPLKLHSGSSVLLAHHSASVQASSSFLFIGNSALIRLVAVSSTETWQKALGGCP